MSCRHQVVPGVRNPPASAGDVRDAGSILGSRRSLGVRNGNPLQCSCLENSIDRGAWGPTVHGATESDTVKHTHSYLNQAFTAKHKIRKFKNLKMTSSKILQINCRSLSRSSDVTYLHFLENPLYLHSLKSLLKCGSSSEKPYFTMFYWHQKLNTPVNHQEQVFTVVFITMSHKYSYTDMPSLLEHNNIVSALTYNKQ